MNALARRSAVAAGFCVALMLTSAQAQDVSVDADEPVIRLDTTTDALSSARDETPAERLDRLFVELSAAEDPTQAAFIAEEIEAIWSNVGSPTAELFTQRAADALEQGDVPAARRLIEGALERAPQSVDAWTTSALIAHAADDLGRAVEDIERALSLEPRNYYALLGFGMILEQLGQLEGAYDAYKRALEVYPLLEEAELRAASIEADVRGRDL